MLDELYQELILDHSKHPRNFGKLDCATCEAHGHNPLCGDQLTVYLIVKDGMVEDTKFDGTGCAISTASASLMTDIVKGKTEEQAKALFKQFHEMVTEGKGPESTNEEFEKLQALAGVKNFPMRVKCATLPWHTLEAALKHEKQEVSTE